MWGCWRRERCSAGTQHLPRGEREGEKSPPTAGDATVPCPPPRGKKEDPNPAHAVVQVPGGRSGAGLRHGVVGPGDRLCVGDSGRLSLEDSEWWRPEEKLRLVCSTVDCLEIFLKRDFLLGRKRTGRSVTNWGGEGGTLGALEMLLPALFKACRPKSGGVVLLHLHLVFQLQDTGTERAILSPPGLFSPVLAVPFPALLAPSGHPCLGAVFPGRANFDGGVLQGSGPQGYFIATLRVGKGSLQHAGPKHQGLTPKSCLQGSREPHISQTSPLTPPEAKPSALLRFTSICWVAAPWCRRLCCSTVRFRDSHAPKGQG